MTEATPTDEIDTETTVKAEPVGAGKRDPLAAALEAVEAADDAFRVYLAEAPAKGPTAGVEGALCRLKASAALHEAATQLAALRRLEAGAND